MSRNSSIPEDQYQHLLDCCRSGQIEESAWQEHLKDKGFREWVEGQTAPSKEPEPLAPEQLTKRLRVKADWLDQPEVHFANGSQEWCFRRIKDAAVDHREAADRIDSDTALIGELVEALEPFAALLKEHHADLPDDRPIFGIEDSNIHAGDLRFAVTTLTRARKRTGGK